MRLHAFVFCDCYEQGRLKRQPHNPKIVAVLPNGDLGYCRATPEQHAAFVTWRSHACRHPEGVITGGQLGHRLPLEVLHRAMSPHSHTFPLLIRKVLGCQPNTRNSHLTFKQVEKLQVELARLKNFHLADRKLDRELRCFYGQMRQLVRAALKFHKPIAIYMTSRSISADNLGAENGVPLMLGRSGGIINQIEQNKLLQDNTYMSGMVPFNAEYRRTYALLCFHPNGGDYSNSVQLGQAMDVCKFCSVW